MGDVLNEKDLAREKYQRQHNKCRGGHTLRARYNDKQEKKNEIVRIQGQLPGDLHHALCYGQVSAPKAAKALGGTCKLVQDRDAHGRGYRGGIAAGQSYEKKVYRVVMPSPQDSSPVVFTLAESRGRKPTRVADGSHDAKRERSPDYLHGWAIWSNQHKDRLNRPIIQEGIEAHNAGEWPR